MLDEGFQNVTQGGFEPMRKKKEKSIARYISVRFIGIILLMAVIMSSFIYYFSNETIMFDIRRQIRKGTRYDDFNIKIINGVVSIRREFIFKENHVQKIILTETGEIIKGSYPDQDLEKYPVGKKNFRKVTCRSGQYFIYDRVIFKKDKATGKRYRFIIRNIGKEKDFTSGYEKLRYLSYLCVLLIVCLGIFFTVLITKKITISMKKVCSTANKIGKEGNVSGRIENENFFQEIDAMAQANNRMISHLEDVVDRQKQFTSDVAHELRTPVSVILAECEYIKKYSGEKEDYEETLEVIGRQTQKINRIISMLLQLARIDEVTLTDKAEDIHLKTMIQKICAEEPLIKEKDITVKENFSAERGIVEGGLFAIAVKNLVNNAAKYSKEHSEIEVGLRKEKGSLIFYVKDHGCGMKEEEVKKACNRFYRGDSARNSEGFGLGLSIAERIAQVHGGELLIESKEGEGSVFSIKLSHNFNASLI